MASLQDLPASSSPGTFHVVIESPRGSTSKLKYDPKLRVFRFSRPLPLGLVYPHDWGFVPGTKGPDGDPIDVLLLSEGTTFPGVVVTARPLGKLAVEQNATAEGPGPHLPSRIRNDRIIAVPANASRAPWRGPEDLPARVRAEIEQFFLAAAHFEQKDVKLLGWEGPDQALALLGELP